jgi:hypothetical protein
MESHPTILSNCKTISKEIFEKPEFLFWGGRHNRCPALDMSASFRDFVLFQEQAAATDSGFLHTLVKL